MQKYEHSRQTLKMTIVLVIVLCNFLLHNARISYENTYDMRDFLYSSHFSKSNSRVATLQASCPAQQCLAVQKPRAPKCPSVVKHDLLFCFGIYPAREWWVFPSAMYVVNSFRQDSTHVVSIFMVNSCVIKQRVTEPHYQNYCHFMRFCDKFIFLHYLIIRIKMPCVWNQGK